jgi:hypothetical protein
LKTIVPISDRTALVVLLFIHSVEQEERRKMDGSRRRVFGFIYTKVTVVYAREHTYEQFSCL